MCWIASSRLPGEFPMDLSRSFLGQHPRGHEFECPPADRAGIERSFPMPLEIATGDIFRIESSSFHEALGQANSHLDRPAVAIPGRQPDQHASATILRSSIHHGILISDVFASTSFVFG